MTRRPLELIARLIGVFALVAALVVMLRSRSASPARNAYTLTPSALSDSSAHSAVSELSTTIARTARDTVRPNLRVTLSRIPDANVRSALAVSRAAGLAVAWTDSTSAAGLAVAATAEADPQGGTVIHAVGQSSRPLLVRDGASLLDSVDRTSRREPNALVLRAARLSGNAMAEQGASRASVPVPRAATLRRILLAAHPGWEAKFVAAALEERGWQVDGSLLIARRASVTLGSPLSLDTARYAAVIVLDSGVVGGDALTRFVRQGGGVILSADALGAPSLAALRPASIVGARPAVPGALLTDAPRQGLDAFDLRPAPRAVVLQQESRGGKSEPSIVAWRIGAGRVLASAYRETWRWRMEGTDDGMDQHRRWWSGLVSAAAFVPTDTSVVHRRSLTTRFPGSAAPYADLAARLGPPTAAQPMRIATPSGPSRIWLLFVVATVALLTEWALRRFRGAP